MLSECVSASPGGSSAAAAVVTVDTQPQAAPDRHQLPQFAKGQWKIFKSIIKSQHDQFNTSASASASASASTSLSSSVPTSSYSEISSAPCSSPPSFSPLVRDVGSAVPIIDWQRWQRVPVIAYTSNRRTRDSGVTVPLVTLPQLIPSFECDRLQHALVTSYGPWSNAFIIDHFPADTHITFVATDPGMEKESLGREQEKHICLHPLHGKLFCDYCGEIIAFGSSFTTCLECSMDFCHNCKELAKQGDNIRIRAMELKDAELNDHDPYAHFVDECIHVSSAACSCTRKRKLTWCNPKLHDERALFHAKIMLLQYQTHLRIIISSFNTDQFRQWERMSDSFWLCDFPLLTASDSEPRCHTPTPTLREAGQQFFTDLVHFLHALGTHTWADRLADMRLDYSQLPANTHLITSIPRFACQSDSHAHGLSALKHVLDQYSAEYQSTSCIVTPVFISAFSIGGANDNWLHQFCDAVNVRLKAASAHSSTSLRLIMDDISCYFDPAMRLRAHDCLWHACTSETSFHSHSKVMCRMWQHRHCSRLHGWVYVGSHNFSKASWGGLDNQPVDHIKQWELGVLSVSSCQLAAAASSHPSPDLNAGAPACCSSSWDLTQTPTLYTLSKCEPLSWYHPLNICKDFISGSVVIRQFVVTSELPPEQDQIHVRLLSKSSMTLKHPIIEFTLSRAVWSKCSLAMTRDIRSSFPPAEPTVLYVRVDMSRREVVWVEAMFEREADNQSLHHRSNSADITTHTDNQVASTSSTPAPYVPPHKRNSKAQSQSSSFWRNAPASQSSNYSSSSSSSRGRYHSTRT